MADYASKANTVAQSANAGAARANAVAHQSAANAGMPVMQAKEVVSEDDGLQAMQAVSVAAIGSANRSGLADNRAQAIAQRRLLDTAANSVQAKRLQAVSNITQNSKRATQLQATTAVMNSLPRQSRYGAVQRVADDEALQAKPEGGTVQREAVAASPKPNNTGLPDNLKSGIESLSGMSMDHVKVHYNSGQPAQLNAHAYAQGSDIHLAPRQEQHLPHEAWHVVQQAHGRVKPTMQMKMGVLVNDDVGLEVEADVMGVMAYQKGNEVSGAIQQKKASLVPSTQLVSSNSSDVSQFKTGEGIDMELESFIEGSGFDEKNLQRKTGNGIIQGKWFHTRDANNNEICRWVDGAPEVLEGVWASITDVSINKGGQYIKLVYRNAKGHHQFIYDARQKYTCIDADGTVRNGYPSDEYGSIRSVFDAIKVMYENALTNAEDVDLNVKAGGGAEGGDETLTAQDLQINGVYTVIKKADLSRKNMSLRSKNMGEIVFVDQFDQMVIDAGNISQYQILDCVASESEGEAEYMQPDSSRAIIPQSALNDNIFGYVVKDSLRQEIANGDIDVVQGKFLGPGANYAAPAFASGMIQAPIGGGGAPAGNPPGWKGGVHPYHHNRGHLMGKQFGGIGGLANLVTLTDGTNHPAMTLYENALAAMITANPAKVFVYKVQAHYMGGWNVVNTAKATGGGGKTIIGPPAPHHVTLDAKIVGGATLFGGTVTINNGLLQNHAACTD